MGAAKTIVGHMTQFSMPNWAPLGQVMDEELMGAFMWMFEVAMGDGTRLHAYKHRMTRRYVHLDEQGRAFTYCGEDRYRRLPLADALELALEGWQVLHSSPEEVKAAWAAIQRARRSSKRKSSTSSDGLGDWRSNPDSVEE